MKHKLASQVIILFTLLTLMFSALGTAPAKAAGPFSHTEVVRMALGLLPSSELATFLNTYQANVQAGSAFPDWGYAVFPTQDGDVYDNYAEWAHWTQFTTAYLNYVRSSYSPPYSEDEKKSIAFLFGIISHQEADTPFHNIFIPYAQYVERDNIFGVPGHMDIEIGVDVFNMFDRGCWDLDHIHGCRYKWDLLDWTFLPTDAIVAAYTEMFNTGIITEPAPTQSMVTDGWAAFKQYFTGIIDTAITNGLAWYTVRMPSIKGIYYDYSSGGMTNMADLTKSKWQEIWKVLGYIYYVKPVASGTGDCSSWENACILETALALSYLGESNEVWVAAGTYKPTTGTDRDVPFRLASGVSVYGGFTGTETARDQRDPVANLTILSGDIDNNDVDTDSNNIAETYADIQGNNSYHVVVGATGATLDGFTVTAGNANGGVWPDGKATGGGMHNAGSSPTITNVIFSGNSAEAGGGMLNYAGSNPTITNVTFTGNRATATGGGMNNHQSSPTLMNVTFSGNSAQAGGGMINNASSPTLTNVTFSANEATLNGGGLFNYSNSSPVLTNVTFSANLSPLAGGMLNDSSVGVQVRNSLLWGNTGGQIVNQNGGAATVTYSVVQDGYTGTGNLSTDPLLGALGNYGGLTQTIPLLAGSSAINTGDDATCSATDQRGVTRPQGLHCDIGAYEYEFTIYLPIVMHP